MKKVLALALAMVLTAGLSSVAFAKVEFPEDMVVDSNVKLYTANSDGELVLANGDIKKGTTAYIPLTVTLDDKDKHSDVMKYKVRTEWTVGGDSVINTSVVYKKTPSDYDYFVAIETKAANDTSKQDLAGKLWVYKTNYKSTDPIYVDFASYGITAKPYTTFSELENDKAYVLTFSNANREDVDVITFEGSGEFEGDFYKQTKLNLTFNTKYNEAIGKAYPDANLEFVNFPGNPSFNKWGTMRLFAEDDNMFIYAVEDGKLVKVEAKYDEEYDAYTFGAKKLATFILSDVELDVTKYVAGAEEEVEAPAETPDPEAKPNPGTGR